MNPIAEPATQTPAITSRRWRVFGIVQGVGFRPWVCLNARRLGLSGEVGNDSRGVWIEAAGTATAIRTLAETLNHPPAPAQIGGVMEEPAVLETTSGFRIAASRLHGCGGSALVPDLAPCPECQRELLDPTDRRYLYPFLACARCGPRYTVTDSLPYDRSRTALHEFPLCPECGAEYSDPENRRFHAESTACPKCGPVLTALSTDGRLLAEKHDAIKAAAAALANGKIVAVQAAGGFQLWVDANRPEAVARLRERKQRDAKPFAVMVQNPNAIRDLAIPSADEMAALTRPEAPIVLLSPKPDSKLAHNIAPGCSTIGLCLPASPLQLLLCEAFPHPVVATSGNLSDEPLCHESADAVARLGSVADILLAHDRKILQPADDSVLRLMAGRPRLLRRARGYAPAAMRLPMPVALPGIAMGGQVKGALALARGRDLVLSPHLGDQDTVLARQRHNDTAAALQQLLRLTPTWVACDSHPDYAASIVARQMPLPRLEVQHHHAHLLAVLAEQTDLPKGPVLGMIWDGSGYGPDGTIWGGEFLLAHGTTCHRVGHLRSFALPGGETAVREPRRSAFAWLWETLGPDAAYEAARRFDLPAKPLARLCEGAAGTLRTSSAGRLFDAVAALAGIRPVSRFEGEAAMQLEASAATYSGIAEAYPFSIVPAGETTVVNVQLTGAQSGWKLEHPEVPDISPWEIDTAPLAEAVWKAAQSGKSSGEIAARFHQTLIAMAAAMADRVAMPIIALGGGCFQNKILLEGVAAALSAPGRTVLLPEQFPANDGGLAAGQALAGAWLHPPT